ncbi:hypothetical protein [Nesterenkonia pannonica]|uniref:hypothetical protein n=1 Tax=Nesterenkonia pannonica TaxID=1548602 RepID=UPI0021649B85|nr:hypothetical protein [Nesterenkonia pannonica]
MDVLFRKPVVGYQSVEQGFAGLLVVPVTFATREEAFVAPPDVHSAPVRRCARALLGGEVLGHSLEHADAGPSAGESHVGEALILHR